MSMIPKAQIHWTLIHWTLILLILLSLPAPIPVTWN